MKKIITALTLSLASAFAIGDCSVKITGNLKTSERKVIESVLIEKGYSLSSDESALELQTYAYKGGMQQCEFGNWAHVTLKENATDAQLYSDGVIVCGIFRFNQWKKLFKEALDDVPTCQ